jgi:uncharacterized protein (TIGR03083 family)
MNQREIVDGLREERTSLRDYVAGLDAEVWDRDSLCSGWRIRDVVAHLAGNCADVVAGNLTNAGSLEYNKRQVDERLDRKPDELLAEWDEAGAKVESLYEGFPEEVWNAELPPPLGSVGRGVLRQLEDLWVHAQDIRIPLDGVAVPGPGTLATLEVLSFTLAERCDRLAPEIGSVVLDAGDFDRTIECPHGKNEVTVTAGPVTLALVATGRVPLAVALEEETLMVTPEAPKGFADALNMYGP